MAADPETILLMSYYRDAELRGASLLLRLMSYLEDGDSQTKLALHLSEEARHAWLWTKRIHELGGTPVRVTDGYQSRIGRRTLPRSVIDLLALTVVVEERSYDRYREHASRADVDAETLAVLREVTKDEKWHIAWIRGKLEQLAAAQGAQAQADAALEKYRQIEREVYGELLEKERQAFANRTLGQTAP